MAYIYFIEGQENSIKIGYTSNLEERKQNLQIANKEELKLLYYIETEDRCFEGHVQNICEAFHIRGEWYKKDAIEFLLRHPWYKENMIAVNLQY
jgi:hypothetical protein